MKRKAEPLLYVEWQDSCSFNRWMGKDDYDNTFANAQTVGWQVRRDKHAITLVSSRTHRSGSGDITIPMRCITRIVRLAEPKRRQS